MFYIYKGKKQTLICSRVLAMNCLIHLCIEQHHAEQYYTLSNSMAQCENGHPLGLKYHRYHVNTQAEFGGLLFHTFVNVRLLSGCIL